MNEDTSDATNRNDARVANDDGNLLPALTLVLGGARSGKSHHAL